MVRRSSAVMVGLLGAGRRRVSQLPDSNESQISGQQKYPLFPIGSDDPKGCADHQLPGVGRELSATFSTVSIFSVPFDPHFLNYGAFFRSFLFFSFFLLYYVEPYSGTCVTSEHLLGVFILQFTSHFILMSS